MVSAGVWVEQVLVLSTEESATRDDWSSAFKQIIDDKLETLERFLESHVLDSDMTAHREVRIFDYGLGVGTKGFGVHGLRSDSGLTLKLSEPDTKATIWPSTGGRSRSG